MAGNKLTAICDLMGNKFTIPHYQRGYRWEDQEVTELLDDLWAFQKDKESGDFYCLQPIVLRENDNGNYDVLDGQQRLTTLYLLLVYLERYREDENYTQPLFSLNYATRPKCETFLSTKRFINNEIDFSNIDFYHICKAYQSIETWFKDEKHSGAKGKLVSILLDKTEKGNRNVRVIRYEVEKETNPIDVFIRLNIGKIPLTDAELTKALLLQSDKYSTDELEFNRMRLHNIATEWDIIETTLQDKTFWYFLNDNSNVKSTHIELIFDLFANKINTENQYFNEKPKKYATFLIFSEHLQDLIDNKKLSRIKAVEEVWKQITEYFEYFKEWFNDRTLYHYIGFLVATATNGNEIIDSLIQKAKLLSKPKFKEHLEQRIAETVQNKKALNKLAYEDENGRKTDYKDIVKILLLHNICATLKSDKEKPRFPFDLYKEQEWSLEHIHAQNSETIIKDKKMWLNDHIQSLTNSNNPDFEDLIKQMNELKEKTEEITDDEFKDIESNVFEATNKSSDINNERVHSIHNLCLLDKATNSQLNNSVFDVKREKIKKRELVDGYYIPICTRNVFLKAYTAYPATNAYWSATDRNDYYKSVESTYNFFINKLSI
jgi:hypothetical protein